MLFIYSALSCSIVRRLNASTGVPFGISDHPVEYVREIFEEVDAMQPAGTCQRIEDASALGTGVASEEQRVSR